MYFWLNTYKTARYTILRTKIAFLLAFHFYPFSQTTKTQFYIECYKSVLSPSIAGITETIAQLASGWLTDRNLLHKYHYHKAYLILCGLVNLLSPLATSYILLMVYAVFFAIFCGGYMALLLPVLVRRTPSLNMAMHFLISQTNESSTVGFRCSTMLYFTGNFKFTVKVFGISGLICRLL